MIRPQYICSPRGMTIKEFQPFTMYKFRSMTEEVDDDGNILSDEQRLTKLGSWLREPPEYYP